MIDRVDAELGRRLRGAGRFQVVRRWPARRLARLRRRGERRRVVRAPGRQRLDHGQGRHHPGTAGGGDHGAAGARSRRDVSRAGPRASANRVYERIEAPATPAQKRTLAQLSPAQVRSAELAGETIQQRADACTRQRCAHRRPQGRRRKRLVRGAAVRHRGHLQDLRGELPRRRPFAPHPDGGTSHRRRRACSSRANGFRRGAHEKREPGR